MSYPGFSDKTLEKENNFRVIKLRTRVRLLKIIIDSELPHQKYSLVMHIPQVKESFHEFKTSGAFFLNQDEVKDLETSVE